MEPTFRSLVRTFSEYRNLLLKDDCSDPLELDIWQSESQEVY